MNFVTIFFIMVDQSSRPNLLLTDAKATVTVTVAPNSLSETPRTSFCARTFSEVSSVQILCGDGNQSLLAHPVRKTGRAA